MKKKSPYKEYNWSNLQKMLKVEVDKLARRQRSFRKQGSDVLDQHIANNFNPELFTMTKEGYISKGLSFYKDKSVTNLQRAIVELRKLNTGSYKNLKTYQKSVDKKNERSLGYIKEQFLDRGFSDEQIEEILKDKSVLDSFYQILNDNVNSKISSDLVLSPLFDSYNYMLEEATDKTVNDIAQTKNNLNRVYNR